MQRYILVLLLLGITCHATDKLLVTHGVAAGEVTSDSACIWSRTNQASQMHLKIFKAQSKTQDEVVFSGETTVAKKHDFTGKIIAHGLQAATKYRYQVYFASELSQSEKFEGSFCTAPSNSQKKSLCFAWGGDLAGQNVARDREQGFPIFKTINQLPLDFFVGLGDMIYADSICENKGLYGNSQVFGFASVAKNLEEYWGRWKYNREDPEFQKLLGNTSYFTVWDDHEVVNDFGPLHHSSPDNTPLMPIGMAAFFDYNPITFSPQTPYRFYTTKRWGKHLEIFFLDTRQYRDANSAEDSEKRPKTMLGREQLTWFLDKLKNSDATWKFIISSVPMSIPTGYPAENGRDGWANYDQNTGFENELKAILSYMQQHNIHNNIWITTDVHFAAVFHYQPFSDASEFMAREYITGPMNAGLFPNPLYDKSLGTKQKLFYGPKSTDGLQYQEARKYFNFGCVQIDETGNLTVKIINVDGTIIYEETVVPK